MPIQHQYGDGDGEGEGGEENKIVDINRTLPPSYFPVASNRLPNETNRMPNYLQLVRHLSWVNVNSNNI